MNDKSQGFDEHDFFLSDRFVADPYPYCDYLREQSPVQRVYLEFDPVEGE